MNISTWVKCECDHATLLIPVAIGAFWASSCGSVPVVVVVGCGEVALSVKLFKRISSKWEPSSEAVDCAGVEVEHLKP